MDVNIITLNILMQYLILTLLWSTKQNFPKCKMMMTAIAVVDRERVKVNELKLNLQ